MSEAFDMTLFAVKALQLKSDTPEKHWAGDISFHCCYHEDKTPSLKINFDKGIYRCFSCGQGGHISSLYWDRLHRSLKADVGLPTSPMGAFIAHQYSKESEPDYSILDRDISIKMEGKTVPVQDAPEAVRYLRRRGIPFSQAEAMQMRYMENGLINGKLFFKRLLIPVYENRKLISIEGRDVIGDQQPKVLYPKDSSVNTLYDWDKLDKNAPLYVVEGLMDLAVLRTDSYFKNSTSIFGASLTKRQIWMLNQCSDVIDIPDNDKAGKMTIQKMKEELRSPFRILDVPRLNNIKDVGDIPQVLKVTVESLRRRGWGRSMKSSMSLIFY